MLPGAEGKYGSSVIELCGMQLMPPKATVYGPWRLILSRSRGWRQRAEVVDVAGVGVEALVIAGMVVVRQKQRLAFEIAGQVADAQAGCGS